MTLFEVNNGASLKIANTGNQGKGYSYKWDLAISGS
jgi:hypothetical protein